MIIGNGKLYTNDDEAKLLDCGAVVTEGNKIIDVGDFQDIISKYPNEEVIDVKGKLIMPGMINTHTHIYSAYARGMFVDKSMNDFPEILENLWWNLDKKLTNEDCKLNALTTYIESIKNGVTTVIDHHASPYNIKGSLFAIAEAAQELGIRTSLCYEVSDRDGKTKADEGIEENIKFINKFASDEQDMIKGLFGLHASFTISDETMGKIIEATEGSNIGFHVHVAEGITDQYDALNKYGKRVVERFLDWGILGERSLAIHCVHTNSAELEILKDTNTNVVHNPESNMGNAVGCPPIIKMISDGIMVGLGTDAFTPDMFESMKVANILHKHYLCDPTVGFNETKEMQFKNNPQICKKIFGWDVGVIKAGYFADIIVMDYKPSTPFNANSFFGHAIFGMTGRLVNDTMINGKLVMKDRIILNVDEEKIFAKSSERAAKLWSLM